MSHFPWKVRGTLLKLLFGAGALLAAGAVAYAELVPWKDYTPSDAIWYVTTIRVDPNMDDVYLEGLRGGWLEQMQTLKKLGQVEDYRIYRSDTPQSGEFNLMLVVKYKDAAALAPNQARFEAFTKAYGEARNKKASEHARTAYPTMRKITGSYMMREISLK